MKKLAIILLAGSIIFASPTIVHGESLQEQILEEVRQGEMELLAQLVQAEAGNQSLEGMRLVADVVINRMKDPRFPNTMEEVIFQMNPVQFTCTKNGGFSQAGWNMSPEAYLASRMEYEASTRLDENIIFFSRGKGNGSNFYKVGDHWFSS